MLINWKLLWTVIDWALKVPKKASDLRAAMRYQGPVRRIKPFLMERAVIAVRARSRWLLALKCVLQSIDNASFQKRSAKYGTKHERLAQLVALSATQAWTAMGLTSLSSGVADSMGLTNATPKYICVQPRRADGSANPYYRATAPSLAPRVPCCRPIRLYLPGSRSKVDELGFVPFDGTAHHAAELCPDAVNISDEALTDWFLVPEAQVLWHMMKEGVYQLVFEAIDHGAIDAIEGLVPEPLGTEWLEGVGGDRAGEVTCCASLQPRLYTRLQPRCIQAVTPCIQVELVDYEAAPMYDCKENIQRRGFLCVFSPPHSRRVMPGHAQCAFGWAVHVPRMQCTALLATAP